MTIAWERGPLPDFTHAKLAPGLELYAEWLPDRAAYRAVVFGISLRNLAKSMEQAQMLAEAHARRKLEGSLAKFA